MSGLSIPRLGSRGSRPILMEHLKFVECKVGGFMLHPVYLHWSRRLTLDHTVRNLSTTTKSTSTTRHISTMTGPMFILFLVASLQVALAFTTSRSSLRNVRSSMNMVQKEAFQLVLLRHGESSWNKENKFTGWYDCPLSEKGHAEAAAAGALLQEEGNTYFWRILQLKVDETGGWFFAECCFR